MYARNRATGVTKMLVTKATPTSLNGAGNPDTKDEIQFDSGSKDAEEADDMLVSPL